MTGLAVPRRADRFDAVKLEGGHLLYDGATLLLLPEVVGAWVWERLDGTSTTEEIVALACTVFDAPAEQVAGDVAHYLAQLRSYGALEERDVRGYAVPPSIGWVRDGPDVLIIDLSTGRRRALTVTGALAWEAVVLLGAEADQAAEVLRAAFTDTPPSVDEDVTLLLGDLCDQGLLTRML